MKKSVKHQELGDFLRTRRERLAPDLAGIRPDARRRRTPGLRREEVAALSGVSLAWYTSMEQGRPIHVSAQVLESLSRTLRLDDKERSYLFTLAGQVPPSEGFPAASEQVSVSAPLQLILDELRRYPAYIVDTRLTIVAWNTLSSEIFAISEESDLLERNIVWRMFTREDYRKIFSHWESIAKSLLAQFRGQYGKDPNDPWYNELRQKLMEISQEFRTWWPQHDVDGIPDGYKEINHPKLGRLELDYTNLIVADKQNMILTVFTPKTGTGTKEKLEQRVSFDR